jgi:hypothetical protein
MSEEEKKVIITKEEEELLIYKEMREKEKEKESEKKIEIKFEKSIYYLMGSRDIGILISQTYKEKKYRETLKYQAFESMVPTIVINKLVKKLKNNEQVKDFKKNLKETIKKNKKEKKDKKEKDKDQELKEKFEKNNETKKMVTVLCDFVNNTEDKTTLEECYYKWLYCTTSFSTVFCSLEAIIYQFIKGKTKVKSKSQAKELSSTLLNTANDDLDIAIFCVEKLYLIEKDDYYYQLVNLNDALKIEGDKALFMVNESEVWIFYDKLTIKQKMSILYGWKAQVIENQIWVSNNEVSDLKRQLELRKQQKIFTLKALEFDEFNFLANAIHGN